MRKAFDRKSRVLLFAVCFLLIAICILPFSLTAQNGYSDVRFQLKKLDCTNNVANIVLQVRAHTMQNVFNMGDANYRFEYNPKQITNPRIVTQANFSNLAPSNDANYAPHNLNGSKENSFLGIVSLNTFFTGSNSGTKRVDTTWTDVTELAFDLKGTAAQCFQLVWHNNQKFPVTGMSEVRILQAQPFNYDAYNAMSGGVFQDFQACTTTDCTRNHAPVATADATVTPQDSTATICLQVADIDAADAHAVYFCGQAAHGAIQNVANAKGGNCLQYKPQAEYTGLDSFCVRVCDVRPDSLCSTVTVRVTVTPNADKFALKATNIISPNGDGLNETLVIENYDPSALNNKSEITIYNQWGDVVHHAAPYKNNWDGKYNNNNLPDGTYYFIFTKDPKAEPLKEFVTIIR